MEKIKLEYIWLDGYVPTQNLRSKTKVISVEDSSVTPDPATLPFWSFDGSSTQQAEGKTSDCQLKPVRVVPDPDRLNAYLVLCEVLLPDKSIHPTNSRGGWEDNADLWIGFEQEYVLTKNGRPLGFPEEGYPAPQGNYYCGIGTGYVEGRDIVEEHLDLCLDAGLDITGINAEVLLGQWEFQLFAKGAKKACDDLILSRYLLARVTEKYGLIAELHPKPVKGNWNGSGMHTNFSTTPIREQGGEDFIKGICEKFRKYHEEHIAVYGAYNDERLTGFLETQSIDKFTYGASDRGSSIRIPMQTIENGWKGYLEDRRPASNADPYRIAQRIIKTLNS